MDFGDFYPGYPYVDPAIEAAFRECKTDEEREELSASYIKVMAISFIAFFVLMLLGAGIYLFIKYIS